MSEFDANARLNHFQPDFFPMAAPLGRYNGGGASSVAATEPEDIEKAKAIEFLSQTVGMAQNVDGRRRFVAVGGGGRWPLRLFTESWLRPRFFSDRVRHANQELASKLAALQHLDVSAEDQRVLSDIFGRINTGNATSGDIVLLNRLVKRSQGASDDQIEADAYDRLRLFEAAARNCGGDKCFTWSDKKVDIDFRSSWRMTRSGRRTAGEYAKAELAPLREMIRRQGTPQELQTFDHFMHRVGTGEMRSGEMCEFARLVSRVRDPIAHAEDTLRRVGDMAIEAGINRRIVWDRVLGDYKITRTKRFNQTERKEAGSRLAQDLGGLAVAFAVDDSDLRRKYFDSLTVITSGNAKTDDLIGLWDSAKKVRDIKQFARNSLDTLCHRAEAPGVRGDWRIVQDPSSGRMVLKDPAKLFGREVDLENAGTKLAFHLEGLRTLFKEGEGLGGMVGAANRILDRIGDGDATAEDLLALRQLLQTRDRLCSKNEAVRLDAFTQSVNYARWLRDAPARSGELVHAKLAALEVLVGAPQGRQDELNQLGGLLNRVRQGGNQNDVRTNILRLSTIVNNAVLGGDAEVLIEDPEPSLTRSNSNVPSGSDGDDEDDHDIESNSNAAPQPIPHAPNDQNGAGPQIIDPNDANAPIIVMPIAPPPIGAPVGPDPQGTPAIALGPFDGGLSNEELLRQQREARDRAFNNAMSDVELANDMLMDDVVNDINNENENNDADIEDNENGILTRGRSLSDSGSNHLRNKNAPNRLNRHMSQNSRNSAQSRDEGVKKRNSKSDSSGGSPRRSVGGNPINNKKPALHPNLSIVSESHELDNNGRPISNSKKVQFNLQENENRRDSSKSANGGGNQSDSSQEEYEQFVEQLNATVGMVGSPSLARVRKDSLNSDDDVGIGMTIGLESSNSNSAPVSDIEMGGGNPNDHLAIGGNGNGANGPNARANVAAAHQFDKNEVIIVNNDVDEIRDDTDVNNSNDGINDNNKAFEADAAADPLNKVEVPNQDS